MNNRKDCPMRHENGNCLPAGGFCTAVNDSICEALHNAYKHGESEERDRLVLSMIDANTKYQERQLKILRNIHKRVIEDTVPVVRCKDCKHWDEYHIGSLEGPGTGDGCCLADPNNWIDHRMADDFCSYGERRTDDGRQI